MTQALAGAVDDRAFPAEPHTRDLAREIYGAAADLPIISMHGHVAAETFLDDLPFEGPSQLLITPDHYLCRMLYSQGYRPEDLGVGQGDYGADEGREIWRRFCENWKLFRGTATRFWLDHEFREVFGITEAPSAESADRIFDSISVTLAAPDFRPRQLLDTFNIEVISTTDAAACDLSAHRQLAQLGYGERILPTFRPDAAIDLNHPQWGSELEAIGALSGENAQTFSGYLKALAQRRWAFKEAGARASDHGHFFADTTPLDFAQAEAIFDTRLQEGSVSAEANAAFGAHMLFEMARMACDDGLVMQIHPGVIRNQNSAWHREYGADIGFDIPVATEFARSLAPLLDAFGVNPDFRCIAFTIDESTYSRELAPMAGAYPAMRLGAPWWFIDSPEAMMRFFAASTETTGFYNLSGFVDDTRAFCSIPARHDLFRRVTAGYLAKLVREYRLGLDEAIETARDLAYAIPKEAYAARTQRD